MKTISLILLFLLGLTGVGIGVYPLFSHDEIVPTPVPEVPSLQTSDPGTAACQVWKLETAEGYGSAWPVSTAGRGRWVFLTAGHVVHDDEGGRPMSVQGYLGRTMVVLGVARTTSADCALILVQGDGDPVRCLSLADREPRDGEEVWLGSYPNGYDLWITAGYAVRTALNYNVSCPAAPGSSGGAILSADGKVLGILTKVYRIDPGQIVFHMAAMEPTVRFRDFVGEGIATLAGMR